MMNARLSSPITGHPAIDQQHQQLDDLILQFEALCAEPHSPACAKEACSQESREQCLTALGNLLSDLLCFLVDHFAYEEQLMGLLPDTPECRRHVDAHTFAHAELSARLSELAGQLDDQHPRECAARLQKILNSWMGGHTQAFDMALANSLEEASNAELKYDVELVDLIKQSARDGRARRNL